MVTKKNSQKFRGLTLGLGAFVMLFGSSATAEQDLVGSRSLAMGGGLRAAPSSEAAVLLNPAGMSLSRAFQLNGLYQYRGSDSANMVNVSIVDSITAAVAAGLYYSYIHTTPQQTLDLGNDQTFDLKETRTTHEVGLALSYPMGSAFHLGLTTKYVRQAVEQPEGTPAEAKSEGVQGLTLDVGGILQPLSFLNLAVTGHNLIPVDSKIYPRLLGMGASFSLGTTFVAAFDTVLNFTSAEKIKPSFHGGGELFLANAYALRGGAMHDTLRKATYATVGLGLVSSKAGLEFGLRQMVDGGSETMLAFSLRLSVN